MPHQSVLSNITIGSLERVSRGAWIDRALESASGSELIVLTGMRVASPRAPIATLSGGNQQKALLARCLFASPKLLLLDEPTRGVDLAARADIYVLLRRLAAEGFGILLCSSEMSEVLTQCHRILVFRDGRTTAEFAREDATEEKVLAAASGAQDPLSARGGERAGVRGGSAPPPSSTRARLARFKSILGLAAVLALSILFSPVRGGRPVFLGIGNLTDILRQVAEKGILSVAMTAVVVSGGIDLSVGSILALAATLAASFLMRSGFSFGAM